LFENRALRGILGPKRDEVTREWRTSIDKGGQTLILIFVSLRGVST
jgi:hypothetical protein